MGRRSPGERGGSAKDNGVCLTTVTAQAVKGRSQPLRRQASEPLRPNLRLAPPCLPAAQTPDSPDAAFPATFQPQNVAARSLQTASATFQPQIVAGSSLQTASATFQPQIVAEITFQTPRGTFRPHIEAVTTLPSKTAISEPECTHLVTSGSKSAFTEPGCSRKVCAKERITARVNAYVDTTIS